MQIIVLLLLLFLYSLTIGPAIENGFYYDFDTDKTFSEDDFEKIEEEIKKIIKEDLPIERYTLPREEAINFMKENNEPYKVELIEELPEGEEISFYKQGEFVDLYNLLTACAIICALVCQYAFFPSKSSS